MALLENLLLEMSDLKTLQSVTAAYSDISALKIQSLRKAFEQNSIFYEQISQLYHSVRVSAVMNKYMKGKNKKSPTFRPKTLHVAVTSNHRFYGTINRDIMDRFISESKSIDHDRLVVGLTGKDYLTGMTNISRYNIIIFQNDSPPKAERDAFLNICRTYDRVFLYYPKFINMMTQTVDKIDIAYAPTDVSAQKRHIQFIYEPELPKILDFFEYQIRTLLFNRVILETELSRTATRLVSMDAAQRQATDLIKKTNSATIKAKQGLINRRLLETFSRVVRKEK